ncbi:GIY-YIG nuclease family protein [Vagococcus fluvialis]|uniref:GIY-YIG nuclease family protein n=1 Tax=Vagococcus fluvialis TaxID=2738 RepID=UPI0020343FBB|nr:GIY-YIG nuclease family protein [Vagococcus fluvialis]MCM2138914.1 GIY-YIG nuclease family protein [Vagococcus fluvialis]
MAAYQKHQDNLLTEEIEELLLGTRFIDAYDFLDLRTEKVRKSGRSYYSTLLTYPGIYVIYNFDKELYYVGQSKDVFKRLSNHLEGSGNGDVYADFKYGDNFKVLTVPLENSGFKDLNELERNFIEYYDAYENGYNKTRGNR